MSVLDKNKCHTRPTHVYPLVGSFLENTKRFVPPHKCSIDTSKIKTRLHRQCDVFLLIPLVQVKQYKNYLYLCLWLFSLLPFFNRNEPNKLVYFLHILLQFWTYYSFKPSYHSLNHKNDVEVLNPLIYAGLCILALILTRFLYLTPFSDIYLSASDTQAERLFLCRIQHTT